MKRSKRYQYLFANSLYPVTAESEIVNYVVQLYKINAQSARMFDIVWRILPKEITKVSLLLYSIKHDSSKARNK